MPTHGIKYYLKRFGVPVIVLWTMVIGLLVGISIKTIHDDTVKEAEREARDYFRLNLFYRAWASRIGGVYVPIDKVLPNQYLQVPNRDITTSDNRKLTLVNPAYMSRMVFESIRSSSPDPIISKIVSLEPLNPVNAPDEWERHCLEAFERQEYSERSEVINISGKPYLRLISMFVTEESCLKCHARQGYRKGDVRGGITISVPLTKAFEKERETDGRILGGYSILWLLGSIGITLSSRRRFLDEEALSASEQKFRTVCDWTQDWEYWLGSDGAMKYVTPSCLELTGYAQDEFMNDPELVTRIVHPDQRQAFAEHHYSARENNDSAAEMIEFQIVTRNGDLRMIQHFCRPIFDGDLYLGRRASNRDITEKKLAEEAKARLEEQLLQSQRMESVGRLAGGVAHDFNNMLGVILGHAEMGLMHLDPASPVSANLTEIVKASQRSAELTRQLLAFARKQTVVPRLIDPNDTISGMLKMLQRLIGENIKLAWQPAPDVWQIKIDPSQLDQILANLCVNSRDAIGETGRITIETRNVIVDASYCAANPEALPGEYVRLSVSDDGHGIDKQMLSHIFEPFFTTKEVGKGTGLGLSTVYGSVKQNSGFINVYSEPGKGTVFSVYLPRHEGTSGQELTKAVTELPARGLETILLVEDEAAILEVATMMLTEQGYTVLTAATPVAALRLAKEHSGDIQLLMTDVIMPEMNGHDLADKVIAVHPKVKVLFMSGYTADIIAHHGVLEETVHFIQKPFNLADMAAKVRLVLDGS